MEGEGVCVEGRGSVCGGGREINKRVSCDNVFNNTVHLQMKEEHIHLGY